jgi:hypothetical protein
VDRLRDQARALDSERQDVATALAQAQQLPTTEELEQLEVAADDLQNAQSRLWRQLEQSVIRATNDGVLEHLLVSQDTLIRADTPLLRVIPDAANLALVILVDARTAHDLTLSQHAKLQLNGAPGEASSRSEVHVVRTLHELTTADTDAQSYAVELTLRDRSQLPEVIRRIENNAAVGLQLTQRRSLFRAIADAVR